MRKMWFLMIVCSVCMLLFKEPGNVVESMASSSANAINLLIKLLGVYAIWLGILEIVDCSGLSTKISTLLSPVIDWLFGKTNNKAKQYITLNLSTNMLGLGNACTPMGIKAMHELDKQNNSSTASHQMILLMLINATSIQLLPTTVLGLRASSGSFNPADIILPSIVATTASTVFAVLCAKLIKKLVKKKA